MSQQGRGRLLPTHHGGRWCRGFPPPGETSGLGSCWARLPARLPLSLQPPHLSQCPVLFPQILAPAPASPRCDRCQSRRRPVAVAVTTSFSELSGAGAGRAPRLYSCLAYSVFLFIEDDCMLSTCVLQLKSVRAISFTRSTVSAASAPPLPWVASGSGRGDSGCDGAVYPSGMAVPGVGRTAKTPVMETVAAKVQWPPPPSHSHPRQ